MLDKNMSTRIDAKLLLDEITLIREGKRGVRQTLAQFFPGFQVRQARPVDRN